MAKDARKRQANADPAARRMERCPSVRAARNASGILDERALANQLIRALEAHVETLKAQLAAAELRAEKQAAEFAAREARHAADLAVERTLADRMSARVDQMSADLAVEQAQRAEAEKRLAGELGRGWLKRRPP